MYTTDETAEFPEIVEFHLFSAVLPHKVKKQYVYFRLNASYFLLPWKIVEEIKRQSMLFNN